MGLLVDKAAVFKRVSPEDARIHGFGDDNDMVRPGVARNLRKFVAHQGLKDTVQPTVLPVPDPAAIVPCFTVGSVIATTRGAVRAEDLVIGDQVITRDNGLQAIRWIGHKDIDGQTLLRTPGLKPVLISAGSLGNGLPERDLVVSPNHRVLLSGDAIIDGFGEHEVLASAKHLTGRDGIDQVDALRVRYIHFMFDQHEVVLSDGTWTESFQPGAYSIQGIDEAQREELFTLFPELRSYEGMQSYQSARRAVLSSEASLLTF